MTTQLKIDADDVDRVVGNLMAAQEAVSAAVRVVEHKAGDGNARGTVTEWHGWVPGSRSARPDKAADTRTAVLVKLLAAHVHREGKSRVVGR